MRKRSKKYKQLRAIIIFIALVMAAVLIGMLFSNKLYKTITIEAGTKTLNASEFIRDKKTQGTFLTDLSTIDMNKPGVHEIEIQIREKVYSSKLMIQDTVAPAAETVEQEVWVKEEREAGEFVKNIIDSTEIKTYFKEQPDFSKAGVQKVMIVLEDTSGNKTELEASLTVKEDTEPPIIEGTKDQTVYIGDPVAYKKDVTITDNKDKDVKLVVDSSAVDLKKAGSYKVIYTATDASGNTETKEVTFIVAEKPKDYVSVEDLNALADKVLTTITNIGMSSEEKAKAIYTWTRANIGYVDHSDKSDWQKAAVQGFKKKSGDCFVYFATAQALLNRAGIQNQGIVKIDGHHYWSLINIDNVWHHFDATPRKGDKVPFSLFMLNDAQLEAYSKAHKNSHVWDKTKYPTAP